MGADVQFASKSFLAAALLAGVASTSISAAPQDVLASFDNIMDKKLVSADGATILITPSERQFTRQVTLPNGILQNTLFIFFTATNGAVANASDPRRVTGEFQITDQGIEIRYSDGTREIMAVNSSGGVTSEFTSGSNDTCRFWVAEGHVFTREEREAALAQYAVRLGLASLSTDSGKPGCLPAPPAAGGPLSPEALKEIAQIEAEVDRIEAATIQRIMENPSNGAEAIRLLGEALLYDKQLSVNRNEACAFCHMPESGFTGPSSELNRTTGSYPGSVRTRFGLRKPQSHSYAPFSPVLHIDTARGDLVGGNFWDMRATGIRLGNPAVEQMEAPPVNPLEMGLPDIACAVYRASQRPYRATFERVWRAGAFAIAWPANVEHICETPGPASKKDTLPVHLTEVDRGRAAATYDQMARSIAVFEASSNVSAFTSKYDFVEAGKATFTADEQAGLDLFRGKAKCSTCHTESGNSPLFTNFTARNTGIPANRQLPFYAENKPDALGFTANPEGDSFVDGGVGKFLASVNPRLNVADSSMVKLVAQNQSRFQVPTLRNVDKRPNPQFLKAYGHNGYFKDLKTIVHFYNTRDVLPRCQADDKGEAKTCWPASESIANLVTGVVGNLGLTDKEEDQLVSFMKTLTDGFAPPPG
jgi:cytochrome c peroxidase